MAEIRLRWHIFVRIAQIQNPTDTPNAAKSIHSEAVAGVSTYPADSQSIIWQQGR